MYLKRKEKKKESVTETGKEGTDVQRQMQWELAELSDCLWGEAQEQVKMMSSFWSWVTGRDKGTRDRNAFVVWCSCDLKGKEFFFSISLILYLYEVTDAR